MQLFRSSAPVVLSVLVLLSNFSCFANAFPLSNSLLNPRDVVCATTELSCGAWCCPPNTTCTPAGGCGRIPPLPPLPTPTPTPTPTPPPILPDAALTSSPASQSHGIHFSSTTIIIIVSVGGGIALLLIIIGTWACHRKRQQGRALLAAYESPDREPYEAISLKTKRSTASFNSAAPPPSAPTDTTFDVPQHAVTPPPMYLGDEKAPLPRFPPPTLQVAEATTPSRAAFPADILGSPRTSSLPPYSPHHTAFVPYSPQRAAASQLEVKTAFPPVQSQFVFTSQPEPSPAFSPVQARFPSVQPAAAPMQAPFSPVQPTFSPVQQQQPAFSPRPESIAPAPFSPARSTFAPQAPSTPVQPHFSPVQTEFSFATHGTTPACSPPVSPHTPRMAGERMFLPVVPHAFPLPQQQQQQQQQQVYPMAY